MSSLRMIARAVAALMILAVLAACAVWVWPTRFRYDPVSWPEGNLTTARTDRFNGRVEVLTVWGWRTVPLPDRVAK